MPTQADDAAALLAELRELCRDVGCDERVRARRLAILRRLEQQHPDHDRPRLAAIG